MLSAGVTVGVAVDLDARQIFFASDGQWDEGPAFGEEEPAVGRVVGRNVRFEI